MPVVNALCSKRKIHCRTSVDGAKGNVHLCEPESSIKKQRLHGQGRGRSAHDYRDLVFRAVRQQLLSIGADPHGITNVRDKNVRGLEGTVSALRRWEPLRRHGLDQWDANAEIGLPAYKNDWGRISQKNHEGRCSVEWVAFKKKWVDPIAQAHVDEESERVMPACSALMMLSG